MNLKTNMRSPSARSAGGRKAKPSRKRAAKTAQEVEDRKERRRQQHREWLKKNREHVLEYHRRRNTRIYADPKKRKRKLEADRRSRKKYLEKYRAYDRARDKKKIKARATIRELVYYGRIHREHCEVCGKKNAEAHHDDYSKPREVRWFCSQHHKDYHRYELKQRI